MSTVCFAVLLGFISNIFWNRGLTGDFKSRCEIAKTRMTSKLKNGSIVFGFIFIGMGVYIFYNTNILNEYQRSNYWERKSADYEKTYKKFKGVPQPKITGVNGEVHLFPKEARVEFSGIYLMKNKTDSVIDTIHANFNRRMPYSTFKWSRPYQNVFSDSAYG